MNNRTKLTVVAAFVVAGIIVGATIGSIIPSLVFAQTSGNSTAGGEII
jgi:hypothetical protein